MRKQFKPNYVKKIIINQKQVYESIARAASWLNKRFEHKKGTPMFLGLLRGSIPFYGHLIMQLDFDLTLDFLRISSYKGALKSITKPEIKVWIDSKIKGKDLIIVEDIVDSAKTMSFLVKQLKKSKPKSITVVCLVDKPDARKVKFKVDFACNRVFGTPFLVGFGLDVKEKARNLPYIAEFDKRYFSKV